MDTLRRFCASVRQGWGRAVHFTQLRPLSQPRAAPAPAPQPSPAPAPEPQPPPVLRVLALHGGYQNAAVFDTVRTKDFQRRLAAVAEFTCLDAPILATPSDDQLRERRSWFNWASRPLPRFPRTRRGRKVTGAGCVVRMRRTRRCSSGQSLRRR